MDEKDIIIEKLLQQVQLLTEENRNLREEIAHLKKNSSNSSKPPSSDIINPQPDKTKKKKRKIGGQKNIQNIIALYLMKVKSIKLLFTNCLIQKSNAGNLCHYLKLNLFYNK